MTAEDGPINKSANLVTAPGLVDLQVNGYAGIDINSESLQPADLRDISVKL